MKIGIDILETSYYLLKLNINLYYGPTTLILIIYQIEISAFVHQVTWKRIFIEENR